MNKLILSITITLGVFANGAFGKDKEPPLFLETKDGITVRAFTRIGKLRMVPDKKHHGSRAEADPNDKTETFAIVAKNRNPYPVEVTCKSLVMINESGKDVEKEQTIKLKLYPKGTHWGSPTQDGRFLKMIDFKIETLQNREREKTD